MARELALLSPSLRRTTSMAAPRFGGLADCSVRIAVHWLSGLPAQTGQPQRCFPVRLLMTDFHAWPFSHSHQALRLLPGVTCCGVKLPLRVGCHCDAITGSLVSRSLNPGRTLRLVQYGQSLPPVHTVGNDRTEGMSSVTEPPHAAIGICAHRLRRQRTVLFPIPLFSKLRMQRSEIIESRQDLLSRAERTACV